MFSDFDGRHLESWKSCMLTSCPVIWLAFALTYIKLDLNKSKFVPVKVQICFCYVVKSVALHVNIEMDCKSMYLSRVNLKSQQLKKAAFKKIEVKKEYK